METRRRWEWIGVLAIVTCAPALAAGDARRDDRRGGRRTNDDAPFAHIGVALEVDALGAGVDAAVAVARRVNLRVGMRALELDRSYQVDGIDLTGTVTLQSF